MGGEGNRDLNDSEYEYNFQVDYTQIFLKFYNSACKFVITFRRVWDMTISIHGKVSSQQKIEFDNLGPSAIKPGCLV